MRKVILFICVLVVTACASTGNTRGDIVFFGTDGKKQYNTSTFSAVINKEYQVASSNFPIRIIVLAAKDSKSTEFISQQNIFYTLDAEKYKYIYVKANIKNKGVGYKQGYYIEANQAKTILDGNSFKIILFDENGNMITESVKVIGRDKLKEYLTMPKASNFPAHTL